MSALSENITIKQPIRRLEIQISNFNVAIPHHVDLLKRHKNNIKKVSMCTNFFMFFTFKTFSYVYVNELYLCSIKTNMIGNGCGKNILMYLVSLNN